MKMFEATLRLPDGKESRVRIMAEDAYKAHDLLKQLHGTRNVPYLPHMIPH
jgi:hypothetical protein